MVEFLSAIDTGIKDIDYDDSEKEVKFTTYHKGKDGELHPLDLFLNQKERLKVLCYSFMHVQLFFIINLFCR